MGGVSVFAFAEAERGDFRGLLSEEFNRSGVFKAFGCVGIAIEGDCVCSFLSSSQAGTKESRGALVDAMMGF